MRLADIAHVRSGDKGDIAQISVIALRPEYFPLLLTQLSADRVRAHFPALTLRSVQRYEVPNLGALNFVLEGALSGGVTRSLAFDAHGKSLATQLLDMRLERECVTQQLSMDTSV